MQKIWQFFLKFPSAVIQRISDLYFDSKYGIKTLKRVKLTNTDVGAEGENYGNMYQPSGVLRIRKILLKLKEYGDGGFVDFGSGKGQVLMEASKAGFPSIVGIEFSRELHEIAVANLKTFGRKHPKLKLPVSICIDAMNYSVSDTDKFFYFFYPFKPFLMQKVIENIENSAIRKPRKIICALLYPADADLFATRQGWKLSESISVYGYECRIYLFN